MKYHGYRIFRSGVNIPAMRVDADPAAILLGLAQDLKVDSASVEVGCVEANSPSEAIDQIRQGFWLDDGYGIAEGINSAQRAETVLLDAQKQMTQEERVELWGRLQEEWCTLCGKKEPCYCDPRYDI